MTTAAHLDRDVLSAIGQRVGGGLAMLARMACVCRSWRDVQRDIVATPAMLSRVLLSDCTTVKRALAKYVVPRGAPWCPLRAHHDDYVSAELISAMLSGCLPKDRDALLRDNLQLAILDDDAVLVEALVAVGASVNEPNERFRRIVQRAVALSSPDTGRLPILIAPYPLCVAAMRGCMRIVRALVDAGADVNIGVRCPLMTALLCRNYDVVEYFLTLEGVHRDCDDSWRTLGGPNLAHARAFAT